LGLAGSVLVKQTVYRDLIINDLQQRGIHLEHVEVVIEPVRGAIALARAAARNGNSS
jgi:hypothetical protein